MMNETPKTPRGQLPEGMRKRGKVYYAWFRFKGRLVRKRLSSNLGDAKSMFYELRGRLERGDWGLLDNEATWAEVTKAFLDHSKQTLSDFAQVEQAIRRFEKYRTVTSIKQITTSYAVGYRDWRLAQRVGQKQQGEFVSPRTVNREIGTIKTMLNKAVAWGLIGSNPLVKFKPLRNDNPSKQRRALTVEEVDALFQASPAFLLPVWRFFMVTGMRRDEVVELRWSDIDFERRTVTVSAERSKNGKPREIPLDDGMMATITRLRGEAVHRAPVPGRCALHTEQQAKNFTRDHVFVTQANTPWRNNLLARFYACCRKAGIMDAKPRGAVDLHSLRVSFTTLSIEHGASPKAIQDILGHSTLGLTMSVYARATDRAKRAAISALPFASASTPPHVLKLAPQEQSATVHKSCTKSSVGT